MLDTEEEEEADSEAAVSAAGIDGSGCPSLRSLPLAASFVECWLMSEVDWESEGESSGWNRSWLCGHTRAHA